MSRSKQVPENMVEETAETKEENVEMKKAVEAAEEQEIREESKEITVSEEEKEMAKKEAITYLGPSIPDVVEHGTVFANGNLTNIMSKQVEKTPILKGLLVKTSKLVQAKKDLRNKESALSAIYRKAEMEVEKNE